MNNLIKDWKDKRIKFNPTIRQVFVLLKTYNLLKARIKVEFLDRRDLGKYLVKKLDKYIEPKQWKELNEEWNERKKEWFIKHHSPKELEKPKEGIYNQDGKTRVWRADD